MPKFVTYHTAATLIPDGSSVMIGGFMGCGNPHQVIAELTRLGTKNLTVICNDAASLKGPGGEDYYGIAKLIHNAQVKKMYATHVGLNPEVAEQMDAGTLELVLVPQGSLVEMIRAGGAGLGGVLTPTGVGTIIEDSDHVYQKIEIDGREYLLERPLRADFALISGYRIDRAGNVWFRGTTRSFSEMMATAADTVIAEAENLVEIGDIAPEDVITPGILVDYVAYE